MNINSAIQGGLMSASTLSLIQEAIGHMDPKAPAMKLLGKPGILRKIRKRTKQGKSPDKLYIRLVNELLSGAAYYGFTAIGKRKNAILKGGLLGAGAGLTALLLNKNDNEEESTDIKKQLLTFGSYTTAGLIAGAAVKNWGKKSRKKNKKK